MFDYTTTAATAVFILTILSMVIVIIDYRKRRINENKELVAKYRELYNNKHRDTVLSVLTWTFAYMLNKAEVRNIIGARNNTPGLNYHYEYSGVVPFALRTTSTSQMVFHGVSMTISRTATAYDVLLDITIGNSYHEVWSISDEPLLMNMINRFEKHYSNIDPPSDLTVLLPDDHTFFGLFDFVVSDMMEIIDVLPPKERTGKAELNTYYQVQSNKLDTLYNAAHDATVGERR